MGRMRSITPHGNNYIQLFCFQKSSTGDFDRHQSFQIKMIKMKNPNLKCGTFFMSRLQGF
jgi:hypothetical protein